MLLQQNLIIRFLDFFDDYIIVFDKFDKGGIVFLHRGLRLQPQKIVNLKLLLYDFSCSLNYLSHSDESSIRLSALADLINDF